MPFAWLKLRHQDHPARVEIDPTRGLAHLPSGPASLDDLTPAPPVSGAVYGALLNHRDAYGAVEPQMGAAPYQAPPKAPMLYLKPANTRLGHGGHVPVPETLDAVQVGAALGLVIGRTATRVSEAEALDYLQGYVILNDVSEPHASVYRPAIRQRCRDGFCPIGPWVVDKAAIANPDALELRVKINGQIAAVANTRDLVRPVAKLLADVTEFMTLSPGDVLHVGVPGNAPLARGGDVVRIEIDGLGWLENPLVTETAQ